MSPGVLTAELLANTTLELLTKEEQLQPYGIQGFRECDVQFLLWRELLLRGYKAFMENETKIDIAIRDDKTNNMIAAIELKGPWLARNFRYPSRWAGLAETDFKKHFYRLFAGLPGQCYSLWIFTGKDKEAIQRVFGEFLECARRAAPGCLVDQASSNLLNLSNPDPSWRIPQWPPQNRPVVAT